MEIRNESIGMDRDTTKEAVMKRLAIGQKYQFKSTNATSKDHPVAAVCTLMDLSKNQAIFKHKNGTLEGLTYQEIWTQMTKGDFI